MIIPEDGCLPQITRKGFSAFNNVMIIKVPEKLKKPNETSFQLATLDRSKKGERWPADQYVDIVMNTPVSKETSSTEKSSYSKTDSAPQAEKSNPKNKGKFCPKKFKSHIKKASQKNPRKEAAAAPQNTVNFNHHPMPHAFRNSLLGEKPPYIERNFNDNSHIYPQNSFSNEHHQLYDNLQVPSFNHLENEYVAQSKTKSATVSREPLIKNGPYNNEFDSHNPRNNQRHLAISPSERPFNDFRPPPPIFPPPFLTNPQENNFNMTDIPNQNFPEIGRKVPLMQDIPNAYNGSFENFPYNHAGRTEFHNNFNMLPYPNPLQTGLNNGMYLGENLPPPHPPPFDNYKDIPNGNVRNFKLDRNPHYDQPIWNDPNHQNSHYHRNPGKERKYKPWRGRGNNRFTKGNNNNRRENNRHQK